MRVTSFAILLVLMLFGCAKRHPFVRTSHDSFEQPGLIVIGVEKSNLSFFLNQNSLTARELGSNTNVFDVEVTDIKNLQREFPEAIIIKDEVHPAMSDDPSLIVDLTPAQARATVLQQLASQNLLETHKLATGKGVVTAVIDSGLNVNRFDIRASVWVNAKEIPNNKIDDDKNGYIDDIHGWNFAENNSQLLDSNPHGTMSSAVIASPLTGIAPQSKIAALKVTNKEGGSASSLIIEALLYARRMNFDIINLSMGSMTSEPRLQKAINELMSENIILIQSAGNYSSDCKQNPSIEALFDLPKFISVAALNLGPAKLDLAKYSNYGECVHIAAPSGEGGYEPNVFSRGIVAAHPYDASKFYLYHGTSAAAPVVSGVAALVKSARPGLSAEQIKHLILNTANREEVLKNRVNDQRSLNALSAVKAALEL